MNDYDPYDILEHDEVRKHLDLVMTNLSKKKESAIDTIGSKVAGILFWKLVGGIGFWDVLECCSQKYLTKKLRAFQKEQLQHLKMHQNDLISEVGHSLVISVLTWAGIARFSGSNECIRMLWKIPWKILSTFSFTDGLEQYWDEDDERRIKLLWAALRNPICLLMNQLYRNHDVGNSEQINYLCSEIIAIGLRAKNIGALLDAPFKLILDNKSIRESLETVFMDIKMDLENTQQIMPSFKDVFEMAEVVKKSIGDKEYEVYL